MASPFKVFRKNQKWMLALLGLLAMLAFVVLPALMQGDGSGGARSGSRVATSSRYGNLYANNLAHMRQQREAAIWFFDRLEQAVVEAGWRPSAIAKYKQDMFFGAPNEAIRDEALVATWLQAHRAEDLGLAVNDQAINGFLSTLVTKGPGEQGAEVTSEDINAILTQRGLSSSDLFRILRQELLAMRVRKMFERSLGGMPPGQQWDYFQRLRRKVSIESIPVQTAYFVDDVREPDEATLEEFFQEHRSRLGDPFSAEPGFRQPKKISIEYLKADLDKFNNQSVVTDEEVLDYYEANKESYRRQEPPTLEGDSMLPTLEGPGAISPTKTDQEPPPAKSDQESSGVDIKIRAPAGEETPAKEEATESKSAGEEKAPADEKPPAAEKPADAQAPPKTDSPGDMSSLAKPGPFRLASYQQTDSKEDTASNPKPETTDTEAPASESPKPEEPKPEEPKPEEPKSEEPKSEEPKSEEPKSETPKPDTPKPEAPKTEAPKPEAPKTEAPKAEVPKTETPKSEASKPEEAMPEASKSVEPARGSQPGVEGSSATISPVYTPLEKVEDEIRRQLAREKANASIDEIFAQLRTDLVEYRNELTRYQTDLKIGRHQGTLTAPKRPDFQKLAEKFGMEATKTELLSAREAAELDIGDSNAAGRISFGELMYERLEVRQPEATQDAGARYLVWKIEEVKERLPDFAEMEDEVRLAWKLVEARSLAAEKAEALADLAREANLPLADFVADSANRASVEKLFGERIDIEEDLVVATSEPFTWLTFGENMPGLLARHPAMINQVSGVEIPGDDFMRSVFALDVGQIGVATNNPRSITYVVRVVDSAPLPEVIWDLFINEQLYFPFPKVGYADFSKSYRAWIEQLEKEAGFEWDPDWQIKTSTSR